MTVMRQQYRRSRLLLRRTIVCLSLGAVLAGSVVGTMAAVRGIERKLAEAARPKPASSAAVPAASGTVFSSSVSVVRALGDSPGNKPAATAADGKWFDDAVFIGDSRTEGLRNYDGLGNATYYAVKGLMVNTVYTKQALLDGKNQTVMQALQHRKFGKVYIMLGINELGWSSMEMFTDGYRKVVSDVKKAQPSAKIYLQSILPVSEKKSAQDPVYNNTRIGKYNQVISDIARENGAVFLRVSEAVQDSSGALPTSASSDGVHLNSQYCGKWCDYLKAHIS